MIKKIIKNEKSAFVILLLLAIIVLTITPFIRYTNKDPLIIGEQPYYYLRIAKDIEIKTDALSYSGREYIFDPYDYFLAFIYKLIGTVFFLPFILGISSTIIFYYLIKKLKLNSITNFLIMLTLILSPIFIHTFTSLNKPSLVIFLMLLGFLLFTEKKKNPIILSVIIFSIIPVFNILAAIISILILLSYSLYKKEKIKTFYTTIALTSLVSVIYYLKIYLKYGFPQKIAFISTNYLQTLISDLGSFAGLSFFNIILIVIGIISTRRYKKNLWPIYIAIFITLISIPYYPLSTIYLKIIVTAFTGIGFYKIVSMRWKLRFIRDLSIFVIILGLLFSVTSYTNRQVNSLPDKNIKESLEYIDVYSDTEEVVLSHYSRGFWIEHFANRATVMDSLFRYAPDPNQRYNDLNKIFYAKNLNDAKELLDKYNIDYIYIDNEMKQGLVWKKEKQGLLFLFRNNETFKSIYSKNGIEIWQYLHN